MNTKSCQPPYTQIFHTIQALSEEFAKTYPIRDAYREFPHDEVNQMRESGLMDLSVPEEYGGKGLPFEILADCVMILSTGNPSVAQIFLTHWGALQTLPEVATKAQLQHVFRAVVDHGAYFGQAIAEKNSKDVLTLETTFTPTSGFDGVSINGTKFFTTGSQAADLFWVLGQFADTYAFAIVPKDAEGLTLHDDWDAMGQRGTASGSITFKNVYVPRDMVQPLSIEDRNETCLDGPVFQTLFSAIYVGIAKAALKAAIDYVQTKTRPWYESGVERATHDPYILHTVGGMQARLSAAAGLVRRAAQAVDSAMVVRQQGSREEIVQFRAAVSVMVAEAKLVSTETALQVCQDVFQVCGARSALASENLDRFWRDVRTLTLHDPKDYKAKLIGEYLLQGKYPLVSTYT